MPLALLTLTAAQLLDLGTFIRMIEVHGAVAEANPLVRTLLTEHGVALLAVAKVVALALVVAVVAVLAGWTAGGVLTNRRLTAAIVTIAIVAGLVGGWTNATAIVGGLI